MNDLRIGAIERKEKVKLLINGKEILAYRGEILLAALIAAGYKRIKKSPIYHEPRGPLCGMGTCFECIVTVNGIPNIRSCMTDVENNMVIEIDI